MVLVVKHTIRLDGVGCDRPELAVVRHEETRAGLAG